MNKASNDIYYKIQNYANRDIPRVDFLKLIAKTLLNFSGCDELEIMISGGQKQRLSNYEFICCKRKTFHFEVKTSQKADRECTIHSKDDLYLKKLCKNVVSEDFNRSFQLFIQKRRIWIADKKALMALITRKENQKCIFASNNKENYHSIALIPLMVGNEGIGILKLYRRKDNFFNKKKIELLKDLPYVLGQILSNQRSRAALRERIKELTCLYGIASVVEIPSTAVSEILKKTSQLLPSAWQYPKITYSRIILDGHTYLTPGFKEGPYIQSADIIVRGKKRGTVEIVYSKKKSIMDEGPFLKEERSLINNIARKLAIYIERRQIEEDQKKLQEQLLHADRLATIGLLTAGVAHELNEPLENILGFAQLALKSPRLPTQAKQDIEKIVRSSLYSREVIKKLMLFSRQSPSKQAIINLNKIIDEGLYFLESRCRKEGIEVKHSYSPNLPEIMADSAQLQQVLVNLVVNAIQAMPNGGTLTIQTRSEKNYVQLIVTDTGSGMTEETIGKIFVPFFTTKEIKEGTGLGLSVVHGIVTSHMGSIQVKSQVGMGSSFIVKLPVNKVFQRRDEKG